MRAFAQKQKQAQKPVSSSLARPGTAASTTHHAAPPHLLLQLATGILTVQRTPRTHAEELDGSSGPTSPHFEHDHSQTPVHTPAAGAIQTKLEINQPGDEYEQEADRVADQAMATPAATAVSGAPPRIQRFSGQPNGQRDAAPASVDQALASPGRPLEPALRQDMEQRLGHDFSRVRLHSGGLAEQSAQDLNAHAYTVGSDVVFGAGRFAPETHEGRRLIAHELAHVVQQTGADGTYASPRDEKRGPSSIRLFGHSPARLRHTSETSIQRQVDFGLATSQNVGGYATKVKAFQSDRANRSKSFEVLARYALDVCNDELRAMDIPAVKLRVEPIDTIANFWPIAWRMRVNTTAYTGKAGPLTIGQLTRQQSTELVESIYHEARHAEQYFKMARLLAGQGKSERTIRWDVGIPEEIAKEAKAKPLAALNPETASFAELVSETMDKRKGVDPKTTSKQQQDFRKRVTEHNQEVQQVQDWYRERPLEDLIYDYDRKTHDALSTIREEAKQRKKGSWDTSKLQPAIDVVKKNLIPRLDTEIARVSAQKGRSRMVTHLKALKTNATEMVDLVQRQTTSRTLITEFELIDLDARSIAAELEVAYRELLTEADAYAQQWKVTAAMKRN